MIINRTAAIARAYFDVAVLSPIRSGVSPVRVPVEILAVPRRYVPPSLGAAERKPGLFCHDMVGLAPFT
jgi:hypothetical protein